MGQDSAPEAAPSSSRPGVSLRACAFYLRTGTCAVRNPMDLTWWAKLA